MQLPDAKRSQYRTMALSLMVIAASGAYRLVATWVHSLVGPLTIPILVAFLIFNIGYAWAGTKVRFDTYGAKLGGAAVVLNFATMMVPQVSRIFWVAVSAGGVAFALLGAAFLLKEATRAPA